MKEWVINMRVLRKVSAKNLENHLQPLNVVLGFLADELNSLQYVGDVVDPPLLHLQHLGGPVKVQNSVCRLAQQPHELLGEQAEGGVVARSLTRRLRRCVTKKEEIIYLFLYSTALSPPGAPRITVRMG